MSDTLPPMPEPCNSRKGYGQLWSPLFTESQMHAYAAAAAAEATKRLQIELENVRAEGLLLAKSAEAMERERWTEAVMQELDSNGHAKAIVAAATACDHRWMVTQQGMTYHDCRCEKCGATKRESWD